MSGDTVRIAIGRRSFVKGYTAELSRELFKISARLPTVPVTYALNDSLGEPIKGKFYEKELQKVERNDSEHCIMDNILKTRCGTDDRVSYYVSWVGYPSEFNSWVDKLVSVN